MKHVRVLLVEDNRINQIVAQHILRRDGVTVVTKDNGREAIEELTINRYDIVFMDVQMPVLDGIEASRLIRDETSSVLDHAVPIVAMTAYTGDEDRARFREAGMTRYLAKPLDAEELRKILDDVSHGMTPKDPTQDTPGDPV